MGVMKYKTSAGRTLWAIDVWVTLPSGLQRRIRQRKIPTKELAMQTEAKLLAEAFEGRHFDRPKPVTVRELWELYLPVAKRTKRSWQSDVHRMRHILKHLGDRDYRTLTALDIERYRAKRFAEVGLRKRGGKESAPKPGQLDREFALLKRLGSFGVEIRELAMHPLASVGALRVPAARRRFLEPAEFAALHEAADPWLQPLLLLAWETGMRRSEVLKLEWARVNLRARSIFLREQDTKSGAARVVPLTQGAVEMLTAIPRHLHSPFVFANPRTGRPRNEIKSALARAIQRAGIEPMVFHDLRRSFATKARRAGVPESVVLKLIGDKTASVLEHYNVITERDFAHAIALIEAAHLGQDLVKIGTGHKEGAHRG